MSDPGPPSSSSPSSPPSLHQNPLDPHVQWLVQKFGGTSVGKFALEIARDIVASHIDRHKVAVVCSARSGSTKQLGTTNLLLRAASQVRQRRPPTPVSNDLFRRSRSSSSPRSASPPVGPLTPLTLTPTPTPAPAAIPPPEFAPTVDLIRAEHIKAARQTIQDPALLAELEDEIERDCEWLTSYLLAAQVIDEISPRSKDNIIGFGERLACKLVTAVLRDQGVDAEYVSLEDILPLVDDVVGQGCCLDQAFFDTVAHAAADRVRLCAPRIPVLTGFFGAVPGSLLRQVGRGYTDLLSALLAAGLGAAELQIWKEVDGIFTADPRKVPTARLVPLISPAEAAELTYYGSEVVHPFTMNQVIRKNIPIRIKNVENPSGPGTVIHPDPSLFDLADPTDPFSRPRRTIRLPTAVTIKDNIVVLNVNSDRTRVSHGFLARIFGVLDRHNVVVDLVSTSEVHVSMAIEGAAQGSPEAGIHRKVLDRVVDDLAKCGTVSLHPHMSILSLVGKHMRNMIGISGRMFTTLAQGGVNIEMISQGASEINISCVIQARDAVKALNLIHQSCLGIGIGGGVAGLSALTGTGGVISDGCGVACAAAGSSGDLVSSAGFDVGVEVAGKEGMSLTGVGMGGVLGIDGRGGRVGPWLF